MANSNAGQMVAYLDSKAQDIQQVLPAGVEINQFMKMCFVACNENRKLLECDRASVYTCVMQVCQQGLSLNPVAGEAHLIPYGKMCTLQFGYRGWIKKAKMSGEIQDIYADVVREYDTFDVTKGGAPLLTHKYASEDRGKARKYVYAVARFKNGYIRFEVVDWEDVDKARNASSKGGKINPAWKTWPEEMAKKVAIKRLCKTLSLDGIAQMSEFESDKGVIDMEFESLDSVKEKLIEQPDAAPTVVDFEDVPAPPQSLQERLSDEFGNA